MTTTPKTNIETSKEVSSRIPTDEDIDKAIAQCEKKLHDEFGVNPLVYVSLEALARKKARRSAIQEAIAKLKEQTSVYDRLTEKEKAQEYNKGLFDAYIEAIALLEKMI